MLWLPRVVGLVVVVVVLGLGMEVVEGLVTVLVVFGVVVVGFWVVDDDAGFEVVVGFWIVVVSL